MLVERSPLDLDDFAITDSSFKFSIPEGTTDIKELFLQYPIDIDYTIAHSDDELSFQLYVKIEVNRDEEYKGYLLSAEGFGFFNFPDSMSTDEKRAMINYSGISICINGIRGYLASLTSHGPMGRYLLPSIDINDLIKKKTQLLDSNRKQKKASKKLK